MANLIIVSGPHAVGKMTVAEELQKLIGYRLMTNHYSIEQSLSADGILDKVKSEGIRQRVFQEAIDKNEGLIFTYVLAYESPSDVAYVKRLQEKFEASGGEFYFIELSASLQERLIRNVSENRLKKKASKNNIERSTNQLIEGMKEHRLNSEEQEYLFPHHLKIDNTYLSPTEVAQMIMDYINEVRLKVENPSDTQKRNLNK